jgi:hypothetical protein
MGVYMTYAVDVLVPISSLSVSQTDDHNELLRWTRMRDTGLAQIFSGSTRPPADCDLNELEDFASPITVMAVKLSSVAVI